MKHLDLFSGIGGFSLAAKWAGIETVQFVEKDKFCQRILKKNFPGIPIHDDIKTFSYYDKIDLVTGGLPCQPFSIAGKQKGKKDDRYLWPEFYRIIKQCKPTWIIAENVTGIVEMALEDMLVDMENEGYETQSFIIPACAANAPHRRDRIWIVAYHIGERGDVRISDRKKRYIQENKIGYMAALQSEWQKLKPEPWTTLSARAWLGINGFYLRSDDGLSSRLDRIKRLGNAIVPQVVYPIMRSIREFYD